MKEKAIDLPLGDPHAGAVFRMSLHMADYEFQSLRVLYTLCAI